MMFIADRVAPENCRHTASAILNVANIGDDMLTQERLKELFDYNRHTGLFTRIAKIRCRKGNIGDIAGSKANNGYIGIYVDGKKYQAHRLAFLYMTGKMPSKEIDIDHINRIRDDNRWSNLRPATRSQNMWNSEYAGYHLCKQTGRYAVRIKVDNKQIWIGRFDTEEEASAARREAELKYHGEYAQ